MTISGRPASPTAIEIRFEQLAFRVSADNGECPLPCTHTSLQREDVQVGRKKCLCASVLERGKSDGSPSSGKQQLADS